MPAHLEFAVALLEIAAFLLVTPEVLGTGKLEAIYRRFELFGDWLSRRWFVDQPVSLSQVAWLAVLCLLLILTSVGWISDVRWAVIGFIFTAIIPAAIVLFMRHLRRRASAIRMMALLGAILFMIGRGIVLTSACSRM